MMKWKIGQCTGPATQILMLIISIHKCDSAFNDNENTWKYSLFNICVAIDVYRLLIKFQKWPNIQNTEKWIPKTDELFFKTEYLLKLILNRNIQIVRYECCQINDNIIILEVNNSKHFQFIIFHALQL